MARFRLLPLTETEAPLDFEWDPQSGALSGPDAVRVLGLCRDAAAAGGVVSHPWPTWYPIHSPLTDPAQMAVVLGVDWRLEGELLAAWPLPDSPSDTIETEDADGRPMTIERIF